MNGEEKNGFSFSYSAPTEEERKEVESIKRDYLPIEKLDKIDKLRLLDRRVKGVPTAVGITIGVLGTLILGLGITLVLEWNNYFWGIILGFLGAVIITLAYPIRNFVYNKRKAKYSKEILQIADEILGEENSK